MELMGTKTAGVGFTKLYVLTKDDLIYLDLLKGKGRYNTHRGCIGTKQPILWKVLCKYLSMKGRTYFKYKEFRKERGYRWLHPYALSDCPLLPGEIRNAVVFGRRNGLIFRSSSRRWDLVVSDLEE